VDYCQSVPFVFNHQKIFSLASSLKHLSLLVLLVRVFKISTVDVHSHGVVVVSGTAHQRGFKHFPVLRLAHSILDFVVVLIVRHSLTQTFHKLIFIDVVSRSNVLGNGIQPAGSTRNDGSVSIAVV
jgi:hypothetical protein